MNLEWDMQKRSTIQEEIREMLKQLDPKLVSSEAPMPPFLSQSLYQSLLPEARW